MEVDTTDKELFTRVTFELAQLMYDAGYRVTDGYWYATEAVQNRKGGWYRKNTLLDTFAMDKVKTEYLKFLIPAPKLIDAKQYLCELTGCTITLDNLAREEMGIINFYFEGVIHKDGEEYSNENMYSTRNATIDQTLQYLAKMFAPKITITEKVVR